MPENWSLEDAATIPHAYIICYNALYQRGEMKKDDKVLIHSGTDDISQAAIHLALHEGCEVFTTVETPEKRKFIREIFPSIPDNHIGNSHDISFEQLILKQTNGDGVNIVLNSLPEQKLQASVRCLAQCGRFLEIGNFDLSVDNPLGMMIFLKEVSFHGIMLDNLLFFTTDEEKIMLHDIVNKGLKNGAIKPLVRKVFKKDELETAFKYMTAFDHMAAGKHVGKVKEMQLMAICRYVLLKSC